MSDKAENRPIATVAVERTFFNLDSDYDYAVPPALADRVRPGVAAIDCAEGLCCKCLWGSIRR